MQPVTRNETNARYQAKEATATCPLIKRNKKQENGILISSAALSAATNSRAFLPYADSLRLRRSTLHETTRRANPAQPPSRRRHAAIDLPPSSQPKSFCPGGLFAGTGDQRRRLAG